MNYRELKALARRADRARGEKRKRLVEKLIRELPKLDPFEGFSEGAVGFARFLARVETGAVDKFVQPFLKLQYLCVSWAFFIFVFPPSEYLSM